MAATIGPGDWIECLESKVGRWGESVEAGRIYCVADLSMFMCQRCGKSHDGPILTGQHYGWCPSRFRPIYRPRADFIEALKAPPKHAPVRTVEPA